jgi:hypothetical protein
MLPLSPKGGLEPARLNRIYFLKNKELLNFKPFFAD